MDAPSNIGEPCDTRSAIRAEVMQAYEDFAALVYSRALALTRTQSEAEDVVQEVFLRYFLHRVQGNAVEHPKSFLLRTLSNCMVDTWRSGAGRVLPLEEASAVPDQAPSAEEAVLHDERLRQLSHVLAPRELDCVRLRIEGCQYSEIGKILQLSTGTVGALLSRASHRFFDKRRRRRP